MRARKRDARGRPVEDAESRLARRIQIWAQTWKRCPKKGCRRAHRCLRFADCAGVPSGPYWPSAEDKRLYFDPIHRAIRAWKGGAPRHDPDARERDAPLPPAPPRVPR
jgi:hypothetical protein